MTAQLQAPVSAATVLMTPEEARACIEEIRRGMENVLDRIIRLHDQEGWRALGYDSWSACVDAELHMSRSRAYQLLDLALINRAVSTIVDTPIPETHARELAAIKEDPDQVRAVYADVLEETVGKPTQAAVRKSVDKALARPSRAATRTVVDVHLQRSVSSKAEPSDCQDIPDDLILGPTADPDDLGGSSDAATAFDDVINNESPSAGPRERFCDDCGDHYRGQACPCRTAPAPMGGASDEPLAAVHSADADHRADAAPAPATVPAYAPAPRSSIGIGIGKQTAPPLVRSFSAQPLNAGDLTRALFDFPAATVVAAMGEALSTQERGSLAAQIIDALPAAEVERLAHRIAVRARTVESGAPTAAPDLREVLAKRPAAEIVDAIAETSTMPRLTELVGLLAERLTRMRLRTAATTGAR